MGNRKRMDSEPPKNTPAGGGVGGGKETIYASENFTCAAWGGGEGVGGRGRWTRKQEKEGEAGGVSPQQGLVSFVGGV